MNGYLKSRRVEGSSWLAMTSRNIIVDQRGAALVISLIMLVVLSLLGALALNTSDTELSISANHRVNVETFTLAERGVEFARDVVFAGNAISGYSLSDADATQIEAGFSHGDLTSGSITPLPIDGQDCPDGIGSSNAKCEYFRIQVTAEGPKGAEVSLEAQIAEEIVAGDDNNYNL